MGVKEGDIAANKFANTMSYRSICYSLVRIILKKDKYDITYIDPAQFQDDAFGMNHRKLNCVKPADVPEGVAIVAQRADRKILFCFDDQDENLLSSIASKIEAADRGEFKDICVMIVKDAKKMEYRRQASRAVEWQRGFFLSFTELRGKAEEPSKKEYEKLCLHTPGPAPLKRSKIMTLTAEVKENIPVGRENPNHYKLRFRTDKSLYIIPGQFIMLATAPKKTDKASGLIKWDDLRTSAEMPASYLKRPFGIHRAFYPGFDKDYLKKLSLPPALATVLHTVFPNEFEVFYKVQPHGVGTQEMTRLKKGVNGKKGDRIQVLAPLGNGLNLSKIRTGGIREIHLIGGGVGMAPLIFIAQALRYYSYPVKAFIGAQDFGMLSFDETAKDATIYIDDLLDIGIAKHDIHVSTITTEKNDQIVPMSNHYKGLVTDQYRQFLKATWSPKKTVAFACGPMGMMKALAKITGEYGVQLKVLMEKRMACGIGVCLSCVCETKTGEGNYSRVCTDGPVFDASEIVWPKTL